MRRKPFLRVSRRAEPRGVGVHGNPEVSRSTTMAESRIRSRVTRRSTFTTFVLVTIATSVSLATSMTGHASPPANHERPGQAPDVVRARPLTLAAADFDADGVPDLLAGYAIADGGMLVLHRGNVDALYPNTPEARARRRAGQFTSSPFLPAPRAFPLP